ncbi:MAG: DUF2095 family protein [Candidatus Hermodarchaeota archaeon]
MKKKKDEEVPILRVSHEEFRRRFPAIYEEIFGLYEEDTSEDVQPPQRQIELIEKTESEIDPFANYSPNVIDFIRRASTPTEALEVINFLEKRNELTFEEARTLKEQLQSKGLESFGSKKRIGDYFHVAREAQTKNIMDQRKKKSPNKSMKE